MHTRIILNDPDFIQQYARVERLLDVLETDEDYINELSTPSPTSSPTSHAMEEALPSSSSAAAPELITLPPMLSESEKRESNRQPLTPLPIPPLPGPLPSPPSMILLATKTQTQSFEPLTLPDPTQIGTGANSTLQGIFAQLEYQQRHANEADDGASSCNSTSDGSLLTTPSSLALPSPLTSAAANAAAANAAANAAAAKTAAANAATDAVTAATNSSSSHAVPTTAAAASTTTSVPSSQPAALFLSAPLAHEPFRFEYGEQLVLSEDSSGFGAVGRKLDWAEFIKRCRSYGTDEVALKAKADAYVARRNARRRFEIVARYVQAMYPAEEFDEEVKAMGLSEELCGLAAEHYELEIEHLAREGGDLGLFEELQARKEMALGLHRV